jgi:hypothetical protein
MMGIFWINPIHHYDVAALPQRSSARKRGAGALSMSFSSRAGVPPLLTATVQDRVRGRE